MTLINEFFNEWEHEYHYSRLDHLVERLERMRNNVQPLFEAKKSKYKKFDEQLPDEIIQRLEEIKHRIELVNRARTLVDKLKASGGFTGKESSKHKNRLNANEKALKKLFDEAEEKMKELEDVAADIMDSEDEFETESQPTTPADKKSALTSPAHIAALKKVADGNVPVDNIDTNGSLFNLFYRGFIEDDDGNLKLTPRGEEEIEKLKTEGRKMRRSPLNENLSDKEREALKAALKGRPVGFGDELMSLFFSGYLDDDMTVTDKGMRALGDDVKVNGAPMTAEMMEALRDIVEGMRVTFNPDDEVLQALADKGYIENRKGRIRMTPDGRRALRGK